jgi:exosome complex RNA-binding protein Csl4
MIDKTIAEGIEKSSITITEVIEVLEKAYTIRIVAWESTSEAQNNFQIGMGV